MNSKTLLKELRERDIHLKADGLTLLVDAPKQADTEDLRTTLRNHKRALLRHLEHESRRLQQADRRGLIIKWSKDPGYIALHDPTTGDWHELPKTSSPPWMLEDARANRRRREHRT